MNSLSNFESEVSFLKCGVDGKGVCVCVCVSESVSQLIVGGAVAWVMLRQECV